MARMELTLVPDAPLTNGNGSASGRSLEELEAIIARGLGTYIEVGLALIEIREGHKYRQRGFATFDAYCNDWLEMTHQRAYQLCEAADAVSVMATIVANGTVLPTRESHVRALLPLKDDPERLAAAWQEATATATNGTRLTAAYISGVVDRHLPKPPPKFYTLADWHALADAEREAALARRDRQHTFNAQDTTSIEWARWSWNPVTGCKHDCSYCYARDIAARYYEQGFVPAFYPSRLDGPRTTKVPERAAQDTGYRNVFTCSMADLFGRWVPDDWIEAVLDSVRANPQWNFLFLTKFPIRLQEFAFPDNAWVGTTVDAQARVANAEAAFAKVQAKVKWLSCEPLLEPLHFKRLDLFQWVVIGGASRSSETPEWRPPFQWIVDLHAQAAAAKCRVYHKTNLLGEENRLRDYPGQPPQTYISIPDAFKMGYLKRDVLAPEEYAREHAHAIDATLARM
jgi:protein gp37